MNWAIKHYTSSYNCKLFFPEEHFGVGDRLLLKGVVREQSEFFARHYRENKITINFPQHIAILKIMKESYGFRTKRYQYGKLLIL